MASLLRRSIQHSILYSAIQSGLASTCFVKRGQQAKGKLVAAALNQIVRHKHKFHRTSPSFIPHAIWCIALTLPLSAGLSFCPFSFTKQFFFIIKT